MPLSRIVLLILIPSVLFGLGGWFINGVEGPNNAHAAIFGSDSTDAFIFACIPVILFYASLYFKAAPEDKRPVGALLTIFAVVIMFWAVFKLNGTALNTWANNYTDRTIQGTTEDVMNGLKLSTELTYSKDSTKLYDDQFRLIKENGKTVTVVDYPNYFKNVSENEMPKEGESISVWSTNLSQSINPFWVIILTPLVVAFFSFLKLRQKEPSTATKIAFGLLISGLSVLVMIGAVKAGDNGNEKVSIWWLMANYGIITIGELFLSPMGLSLVSKLSPVSITSLMMGGWFLATSIGNKLSGVLASMWDGYDNKADFFWINFMLLLGAAGIMFLLLKRLNSAMQEKGVH
jgi:POT family proton-dependent oligopeptide transporter